MKKNTNEYLSALAILKIKELPGLIAYKAILTSGILMLAMGIILVFFGKENDYLTPNSEIIFIFIGFILTFFISPKIKETEHSIKRKELKEKYENDKDFSDIIANL